MGFLPAMPNHDGIRKSTQVKFGGYDHNVGAGDGALWDMKNMSGDLYPVLSSRRPRRAVARLQEPYALYAHDGLYWVDGDGFYADGERKGTVTPGKKQFASLQRYILIFPDKKYYRTDNGEFGSLEAEWTGNATICDGSYNEAPAIANTVKTEGEAFPFSVNEAVAFYDGEGNALKAAAVVEEVAEDGKELRFLENSFSDMLADGGSRSIRLVIKREVPDLEFLCENENRVWGCKGDTIYASYLGSPFIWNNFSGVSTDSYAVDVGSAGDFTACCSYLGYPVFFKEDAVYKVYGNKPGNFEVMSSARLGVMDGSSKSLAVAGERLFYLSRAGIVSYAGGTPENISHPFGSVRYRNGVGGSDGRKYYVSLEDEGGCYHLFVYDTGTGLWHREDETEALGIAWNDELFFLNAQGTLWSNCGSEEELESYVEFGDFVEDSPNKKGVSRLQLRLALSEGTRLTVKMRFDSAEEWQTVRVLEAGSKKSFPLPIVPRRCDHWRLRLEATGPWQLYSMSREFYRGSDLQ